MFIRVWQLDDDWNNPTLVRAWFPRISVLKKKVGQRIEGLLIFCFVKIEPFIHFYPPYVGVMECGAEEVTGLGFICFVFVNPRVLSATKVDLGFFVS